MRTRRFDGRVTKSAPVSTCTGGVLSGSGRCRWTRRLLARITLDEHHAHHREMHRSARRRRAAWHGFGGSRGALSTKAHQLVDGSGLPLVTTITPGQSGDSPMVIPLLGALRGSRPFGRPRTRLGRLRGDKAYSSRAIRTHWRSRGMDYRRLSLVMALVDRGGGRPVRVLRADTRVAQLPGGSGDRRLQLQSYRRPGGISTHGFRNAANLLRPVQLRS